MKKVLKRPLSILLAALMVVSLFVAVPTVASAANVHSASYAYNFVSDLNAGDRILGDLSEEDDPDMGGHVIFGELVTVIDDETGVTIADQVTSWYADKDYEITLKEEINISDIYWDTGEYDDVSVYEYVFHVRELAPEPTTYTIYWKNGDDILGTNEVAEGDTPVYGGATPTKPEDENNTYTFSGWTDGENTYGLSDALPAVTADVTYTATFEATPKAPAPIYKVTWNDWDGTELGYTEVAEGDAPLNPYEGLAKDDDVLYTYTFTGWTDENGTFYALDAELPAVTADITYTATFEAEPKTVEIINGKCYIDGELAKGAGLVPYEGDYYYVKVTGALYMDASLVVSEAKSNGLLPAGNYKFDEEGKLDMRNGVVHGRYFENGTVVKGAGAVEFNGDIYYVKQDGSVFKDGVISIPASKTNGLVTKGSHRFDSDGKFVH